MRRRDLFHSAAAMTAASYSRVLGANDAVRLGVIGCGARGLGVMGIFAQKPAVQVAAVCDVYGARVDEGLQRAPRARGFTDHRKLLEMKEVDAVLIATPDHWHSDIALDALNAGKDIYIEKPLTLTIDEGPPIIRAARVNNRVCQVGMQQRSGPHYLRAKREIVDAGKLGKVTHVRTWWHGAFALLRKAPASLERQPSNLDWARYLGRVRWRDYDPQQYFNFRAYLDFGGGLITDLFTHWVDVAHMFMGSDTPVSANAAGGIYFVKDGRTAPDTINVTLEYPANFTVTFDATLAPGANGAGVEFYGSDGRLFITRQVFEYYPADKTILSGDMAAIRARFKQEAAAGPPRPELTVRSPGDATSDHVANFLDCVRSRNLPNADVLVGHRSARACHLATMSYLQRRRVQFDPVNEVLLDGGAR